MDEVKFQFEFQLDPFPLLLHFKVSSVPLFKNH